MNWIGTKNQKETITNDGYHLVVVQVDPSRYTWIVSYNGSIVNKIKNQSSFKTSLSTAKRQAIRLMINHLRDKVE